MKKLTTITLLTIVSTFAVFAQNGKTEQEILKFIADYDQAYVNKDIAFAERIWANNYVISTDTGERQNRAESLESARKEWSDPNPKYKLLSFKSVNDSLHINGSTAIASGGWTSEKIAGDNPKAAPHIDTGRYTLALEKQKGKWMVVAEHYSETPHDRKAMEAQVLKLGREYGEMIRRGDAAEIEKILDDDYLYTDSKGKMINKAEDLASFKSGVKFDFTETTDQKVKIVGNNIAVETGTFRFKGTDKDGKSFEGNERYTTTWIARNGQWKIVSDHSSEIKK